MKRLKALLLFLALSSTFASAAEPVRILFIGNSAIYFHNLPQIIKSLAASGPKPIELETELISEGGQTLEGHWREGKALQAIRSKRWNYVVLQEQSGLGEELKVNGVWRIIGWESYHRFARMFNAEIKAAGAKTVLLSLWSHLDTPQREQQVLDYASWSLAKEIGAILVPAGSVWRAVEKADPSLKLYWDSFHPLPAASYMFAATFYASVFHRDPAKLANKATGNDIDIDDKLGADSNAVIAEVAEPQAAEIKRIAYDVVRHQPRSYPVPSDVELPSLPLGRPMSLEILAGEWEGTEEIFSPDATKFEVNLHVSGSTLLVDTHLALKSPIAESGLSGGVEGRMLVFENPKGVDGLDLKYRAVFKGDELVGTVEAWRDDKLVGIGLWQVKRKARS